MNSNTENQRVDDGPFVLFADDDPEVLSMIQTYLQYRNWKTDYAKNAIEIIELVNKNCEEEGQKPYDVIVADINYFNKEDIYGPRLSGITAAREIRKVHQDVPIVFLTGYDNALIRGEVRRIGAKIVMKPVLDYEHFFDWIEDLALWHQHNHGKTGGSGGVMDDSRWQVGDIHTSDGQKLCVPRALDEAFKKVSKESSRRPKLTLKQIYG